MSMSALVLGGICCSWSSTHRVVGQLPHKAHACHNMPCHTFCTMQAIHGLGAGGNKAAAARAAAAAEQQQQQQGRRQETAEDGDDEETGGGGRGRGPGGRGGSSGGRGAPNYARKEQNKAAVGNHHRKDRAMKKMGLM